MNAALRYTLLGIAKVAAWIAVGLAYATDGMEWVARKSRNKADSLR